MKWVPKHLYTILLSLPLSYRKRFPMPKEKNIIHIRRVWYFILRISMVILRTAPSFILYAKSNVHGFRRWERYTSKLHHNSNKLWNQGQSKNMLNLNVLSIMYLRDIWHDDPLPQRFIRLFRHITKWCTSNRI